MQTPVRPPEKGDIPVADDPKMQVGAWMTTPVEVISPTTPMLDAYTLLMRRGIRRLPVVEQDRLVGIVTLGDLREARPSSATSLSIYELNYLLAKLVAAEIMTHTPYTVQANTPIREAVRLMLEHKIGGLPVVDSDNHVVGILTESDLFRLLAELVRQGPTG
ncbi:MAG TPA: CBS domain-containing protein [Chloroflexia bacterium]|nr:CBS domain-containing protein [Chloroflexia bacterium]